MSKTSKTQAESKPPAWASPLFQQSARDALSLYRSGAGGNTYTGSTVGDMSDTTLQGINQLAQAGQAWDTAGTRPLFQGIGAESVGPSNADRYLTDYASGEYLQGEGNPFYRQRLEGEIADSNAMIRSTMSGLGRYGSDVSNETIADNTSNMLLRGLEEDFNRQTQNQFNAVGMLDQQRNTGLDRALSSAGAMAGLDQQNFTNRLQGAGATLQAGGMVDDYGQRLLNDDIAKWYAVDNEDWNRLAMLQGAAAGAAGNYGVQNQTSRQPINPWGAIGGLFSGKSDIRLKENIVQIGEANGIPVFEFSYKGQKDRWRGTMAQAIPMHRHDAVIVEDDGYMAVDYGRLGFMMERA